MSEWYELAAIEEVTRIIGKKWVKYKDDEDSEDEETVENKTIEKLQSLRHVSIIVP